MRISVVTLASLLALGLGGTAMAAGSMSGPAMHPMTHSMKAAKTGAMMHPAKKHWMKKQAMKKKHKKMAMHKKSGIMAMHANAMKGSMAH
jgi:hypothetical protein